MLKTLLSRLSLHTLIVSLVTVFAGALLTFTTVTPASALCIAQPMEGSWQNINANTRSMTRVVVRHECGDTGGPSYWAMRPYGKCHPTDCDWGYKRAYPMSGGWQRATYTHSWSTKYVWVKTYTFSGKLYLRVYTWTDFTTADGRTDYSTDEWMLK